PRQSIDIGRDYSPIRKLVSWGLSTILDLKYGLHRFIGYEIFYISTIHRYVGTQLPFGSFLGSLYQVASSLPKKPCNESEERSYDYKKYAAVFFGRFKKVSAIAFIYLGPVAAV